MAEACAKEGQVDSVVPQLSTYVTVAVRSPDKHSYTGAAISSGMLAASRRRLPCASLCLFCDCFCCCCSCFGCCSCCSGCCCCCCWCWKKYCSADCEVRSQVAAAVVGRHIMPDDFLAQLAVTVCESLRLGVIGCQLHLAHVHGRTDIGHRRRRMTPDTMRTTASTARAHAP